MRRVVGLGLRSLPRLGQIGSRFYHATEALPDAARGVQSSRETAARCRRPHGQEVHRLPDHQAIEAETAALVGHRPGGRGAVRPAAAGGAGGADRGAGGRTRGGEPCLPAGALLDFTEMQGWIENQTKHPPRPGILELALKNLGYDRGRRRWPQIGGKLCRRWFLKGGASQ